MATKGTPKAKPNPPSAYHTAGSAQPPNGRFDSKPSDTAKSYWDDVMNAQGMGWPAPANPNGMFSATPPAWYLALGAGRASAAGYQRQTPYGWMSDNEYRNAVERGQIQGTVDSYSQADPYGDLWSKRAGDKTYTTGNATGGGAGGSTSGGGGSTGGSGSGGTSPGGGSGTGLGSSSVQGQLSGLSKYDQDAASSIIALFDTYGLSTLAPKVIDMIKRGMGQSAIVATLRETPEYKARFPGMDALKKQGYNAISEAQYLQLEDSYHSALQSAGLPKGFYDKPDDFVQFIANGVDPAELKQRANAAVDLATQVDPTQRDLLSRMYGVGSSEIAAYLLDPKKAMPILQKQLQAVQIGSAAEHAGIDPTGQRSNFESLIDNGVSPGQAAQGFSQIATEMAPLQQLSQIWGGDQWNLKTAEDATFYGNAAANQQKKRLTDQEKAAFSGASGYNPGVSGQRSTAGSF